MDEILASCVTIQPNLDELQIKFIVRSPDPVISARLANLFVEETITFQLASVIDRQLVKIEDLQKKVDQVAERIRELEKTGGGG